MSKRRKEIKTYDHLLDKFDYKTKDDIIAVLKNFSQFKKLGELGVSSALSILADISKSILCEVDGFSSLSPEEFEAIYYAYICNYGLNYAAMICGKSVRSIHKLCNRAIRKIYYVLKEEEDG